MNEKEILDQVNSCIECEACLEVCDTFLVSNDILKSPNGRLKISGKIFNELDISEEELKAIYTCTLCSLCDDFCQQEIPISEIIHSSKIKLVEHNLGPLEIHNKITQGIIEKDNSVNGDPAERLNWIPDEYRKNEIFEKANSHTLLFLGCMSSFRVKESASASYTLLKKGGYDFKILEKEPCCGEYVYSSGNLKLVKQMFKDNFDAFKKAGINTIITTCAGCLYAFNNVYPKYLPDWNIEVKHVIQVIHELFNNDKLEFKKLKRGITYHDPCRTGRKLKDLDIYDEPRELLKTSCENLFELTKNREITPCCGAGSGVRGVDSNMCIDIGLNVLNDISTKELITACPLCAFNYRYIIYKKQLDNEIKYVTDYLLEALDER